MNEGRKRAYRSLVYRAMLDIRTQFRWGQVSWNPRQIWTQYQRSRRVGALANWLHNLALYSQDDFQGFREDWFWEEYERFKTRFPERRTDYKQLFEDELKKWEEGEQPM